MDYDSQVVLVLAELQEVLQVHKRCEEWNYGTRVAHEQDELLIFAIPSPQA